jgi:hypothetical protein
VPALEALQDRLRAAHAVACGLSVDSAFCQAAWAEQLGGVSLPLIPDFHPKGEIAESYGLYLRDKGISDRATIIIDAGGTVRYAESVTPAGKREMASLVAFIEQLDSAWTEPLSVDQPPLGLEPDTVLYIRDHCMFSRWALYARTNLHLQDVLPVFNVSRDEQACAELERIGGKPQAPALRVGDVVMYESAQIASYLSTRASWRR